MSSGKQKRESVGKAGMVPVQGSNGEGGYGKRACVPVGLRRSR